MSTTTSTPALSILIPIYNVEAYLRQSLASVTSQTLKDLEIICINDGSTDQSLKIVQEFATQDPRIQIINKPNSGYGDSMNLGLKRAHGTYIGILEPDDWIEPDAFEKLYAAAKKYQADVVKANYYKFRTIKNSERATITTEISPADADQVFRPAQNRHIFHFAPAIWSAIYRREFLLGNDISFLPTPGASYQDLSFNFKVWTLAKKVVLLPDAFVHYRLDNSNSSVNNPNKLNCVVDEYAEIETFLCERGLFAELGTTMYAVKFGNYHWNFQRLSPRLAKQFFQTWRQEFLSASDEGLLIRENFRKKDWLALRTILKHPHLAYRLLRLRARLKH